MKLSELWLREWVNPALNVEQLAQQLSLAGLEVAAIKSGRCRSNISYSLTSRCIASASMYSRYRQ